MVNNNLNPNLDRQSKKNDYTIAIAAVIIIVLLIGSFIYFASYTPSPERTMTAPTPSTPGTTET